MAREVLPLLMNSQKVGLQITLQSEFCGAKITREISLAFVDAPNVSYHVFFFSERMDANTTSESTFSNMYCTNMLRQTPMMTKCF